MQTKMGTRSERLIFDVLAAALICSKRREKEPAEMAGNKMEKLRQALSGGRSTSQTGKHTERSERRTARKLVKRKSVPIYLLMRKNINHKTPLSTLNV